MICAAYGENDVSHTICKRYKKFRQGDFSLEKEPCAERPQKIETDELQALLNINSAQTEKELAEQLGVMQQAISICLPTMGKVQKEGRWVPHELSEDNKNLQHNTALTLLSKLRKKDFLHKIITGNEKWILLMITLNVKSHGLPWSNFTIDKAQYPRPISIVLLWWD